jgi:nitrous oxidase accessory protein
MSNNRKMLVYALIFVLSFTSFTGLFAPSKADTVGTSIMLPYTITEPGTYNITGPYTVSGIMPALSIQASDVLVDGQNYQLTPDVYSSVIGIGSTCKNITLLNINEVGVSGSPNSGTGISTYGASNVTIKDSSFENNYWGMSLYLAGYGTAANFTLTNCSFTNNVFAIQSSYGSNFTFTNSVFDSNGNSIDMSNSSNVSMQSCSFSNDVDSVNLQNSTNLLLQNCNINATSGPALDVTNTTNFSVLNSCFSNCDSGLDAVNATNFTIRNCIIENNTGEGLDARGTGNFTVRDSSISGNGDSGLWVTKGNFTVTNCTLNDNLNGIMAENCSFLFSNVTMNGNNAGLDTIDSTVTVQDTIVNGSIAGVNMQGCNATVTRCKISFCDFYGLAAVYGNISITNCDFTNNSMFGLMTLFCNTTTIRNCNVVNSTLGIGVNTYGSSEDTNGDVLLVENCAIRNNSVFGFVCGFVNASISNNFFESNGFGYQTPVFGYEPFGGGLVLGDTNATVTDNIFSINNDALIWEVIDREESNTVTARDNNFQNNNCTMNLLNLYENSSNQRLCFYNNLVNDTYYFNPDSFTDDGLYPITSAMLQLNTTLQAGQRIYGAGRMICGNYWAHPNGTGPSQIGADANHDGYIDTPFDFFGNQTVYDYLPLSSNFVEYVDHLTISPQAATVAAGTAVNYIVTAYDQYGNCWNVTADLAVNGQPISGNSVCIDELGLYTIEASYGGKTVGTTLGVTPGPVNRYVVLAPSSATVGTPFAIRVVAIDAYTNIVTSYSGTVTLSANGTTLTPSTSDAFSYGEWQGTVTISQAGTFIITATDGSGNTGKSQAITIAAETPTPTPTPNPTPTTQIVQATKDDGSKINLSINGNITSTQMSNITITTDQTAQTTTISFTVTGVSGDSGLSNITIAKDSIPYGTSPTVMIDGVQAENQGYTQDSLNYYVWYTTSFSTHQIRIVFAGQPAPVNAPLSPLLIAAVIAVIVLAIAAVLLLIKRSHKTANTSV